MIPKIISLTPAQNGWWAKFYNDGEWYAPIAAWALCEYEGDRCVLPLLPSEAGMVPHSPDEGHCDMLYLPDGKFVLISEETPYGWKMVSDGNESSLFA